MSILAQNQSKELNGAAKTRNHCTTIDNIKFSAPAQLERVRLETLRPAQEKIHGNKHIKCFN